MLTKHRDISQVNKKSWTHKPRKGLFIEFIPTHCLHMRKSDERTAVTIHRLANACAHTVTIVFLRDEPKCKRCRYHHICIITTRNGNDCGTLRKWRCLSCIINKEEHKFWTESESVCVMLEKTGQLSKIERNVIWGEGWPLRGPVLGVLVSLHSSSSIMCTDVGRQLNGCCTSCFECWVVH